MKNLFTKFIYIVSILLLIVGCKKKDEDTTPANVSLKIDSSKSYTSDYSYSSGTVTPVGGYGSKSFDLNGDGTNDIELLVANTHSPGGAVIQYSYVSSLTTEAYISVVDITSPNPTTLAKIHLVNDVLDESENWKTSGGFDDSWDGDTNKKFVGLKFVHNGTTRYGWLQISFNGLYTIQYYRHILQN